ncbi:MAG: hypothetical protein HFG15_01540 [Bacilli bacterium]|jgi:uncharacterized protein YoxC|nr:hypothetical protein [Bacilli bacterium]
MICINELFPIILYMLGSILLIVMIVLGVRLIQTLNRVDTLIDDVNLKASKLNGVFDIVDHTADALASVSDMAVGYITRTVSRIMNRKRKEDNNYE